MKKQSYDPSTNPYVEPDYQKMLDLFSQYGGGTPEFSAPTYQPATYRDPSSTIGGYNDWASRMYGGSQDFNNTLSGVRGIQQTPFLDRLPWNNEQITGYIQNQLTGKGASERADKYKTAAMRQLNQSVIPEAQQYTSDVAATGGRGSSFDAAMRAKGRVALGGARAGVELNAMTYEDALRQAMQERGMGALGAYEGAARGDWTQALQQGQLALSSLDPELASRGQDIGMQQFGAGLGMQGAQMGNEFNLANAQMGNQFQLASSEQKNQFAQWLKENGDQNFWNAINAGGGEAEMQQAWQEFQAQMGFNYYSFNKSREKSGGIKGRTKNWDKPKKWSW